MREARREMGERRENGERRTEKSGEDIEERRERRDDQIMGDTKSKLNDKNIHKWGVPDSLFRHGKGAMYWSNNSTGKTDQTSTKKTEWQ